MTHPSERRKTRLADRRFQFGLAWRMLLVFLLFFVAGVLLVFAPSVIGLVTGADLAELEPAAEEFLILHRRIWPAVLFVLAGVFFYTLIFSHRIAGPIHRINKALEMMLRGEFPKSITLRKGDQFQETAKLLECLSHQIERQRKDDAYSGPTSPAGPGESA
ncbi:MAG: hypothetical protein OEM42_04470 [Deltaproteobacteria bacterium]|nr:hypothetical protein [Deltaproteobacteria bacterium]MDH3383297.1 hypothetical protein [Deltaproteobacteria bacterium]